MAPKLNAAAISNTPEPTKSSYNAAHSEMIVAKIPIPNPPNNANPTMEYPLFLSFFCSLLFSLFISFNLNVFVRRALTES